MTLQGGDSMRAENQAAPSSATPTRVFPVDRWHWPHRQSPPTSSLSKYKASVGRHQRLHSRRHLRRPTSCRQCTQQVATAQASHHVQEHALPRSPCQDGRFYRRMGQHHKGACKRQSRTNIPQQRGRPPSCTARTAQRAKKNHEGLEIAQTTRGSYDSPADSSRFTYCSQHKFIRSEQEQEYMT